MFKKMMAAITTAAILLSLISSTTQVYAGNAHAALKDSVEPGTVVSGFQKVLPTGKQWYMDPVNIAVDKTSGNVFILNNNNSDIYIQKMAPSGNKLSQWLLTTKIDDLNDDYLYGARDIAVDIIGSVYVADTQNNCIQKFDKDGKLLNKWGTGGHGNGQFIGPTSVALDKDGNIYVADNNNNRIEKFSSAGAYIKKWDNIGSNRDYSYGVSLNDITVDNDGNIYLADGADNTIKKYSQSGALLLKIGSQIDGDNAQLHDPESIFVDADTGNIVVSDGWNSKIKEFSPAGKFITNLGVSGSADGQFSSPVAIAQDSAKNIYVADASSNKRVLKLSQSGKFILQWGMGSTSTGKLFYPTSEAFDVQGNIYILDEEGTRIQKFAPNGSFLAEWPKTGSAKPDYYEFTDITIDNSGFVYAVDKQNHCIMKFNPNCILVTQWGSRGNGAGEFNELTGITSDGNNKIYVIDSNGNYDNLTCRVQIFDASGKLVKQIGGVAGSANGELYEARDLAVDSVGNVLVADTENNRIEKFSSTGAYLDKYTADAITSISVDSKGCIFYSSEYSDKITKLSSNGALINQFSSGPYCCSNTCLDKQDNLYFLDTQYCIVEKHKKTYTVNFNTQGGNEKTPVEALPNTTISVPTIPTRSGYTFGGWYKQSACTTAWNFTTDKVDNNITLYARWLPIPAVPAGVKAVSITYNSIKVSWNVSSKAVGYEVYRAASQSGPWSLVNTLLSTSFTNTGLTSNATYYYKVRAYALTGTTKSFSSYSSVVSAKPVLATPVVKAVPLTYNSAKISWGATVDATMYELYRSISANGTYKLLTATATLSYTDMSLATGTTYYYKVRAYHLAGSVKVYGAYSSVVSVKATLAVPASLKAVRASATSIKITWGSVPGATKYEVCRCITSATGTYTLMSTTTYSYYTNTGLTTGKTYWYKVRAYRLVGSTKVYSNYSAVVYAKP